MALAGRFFWISRASAMASAGSIWHSGSDKIVGYVQPASAGSLVQAWANSAGHRAWMVTTEKSAMQIGAVVLNGKLYGAGAVIGLSDRFDTFNRFYGGQLGLNTEVRMNNWYLNATGKVALGVVNQRMDIRGVSTLQTPGSPNVSVIQAGLYANATNNGRYSQDKFGVVPEVGVNLGYSWRSWLTTSIGYNFLYLNSVVRPSEQYSTTINPSVVPLSASYGANNGVVTPNPAGNTTDFFFQSINFTIAVRY